MDNGSFPLKPTGKEKFIFQSKNLPNKRIQIIHLFFRITVVIGIYIKIIVKLQEWPDAYGVK